MEFLKSILGDELFTQFESKINEYNGNEANKDKKIKLANLSDGGYVAKGKYTDLETTHNSKLSELENANKLIAELKKSTKADEGLQSKISEYESEIEDLNSQLEKERVDNAIKIALLEAKVTDIDYMTYKLKDKEEITIDDKGHIEGWEEMLSGLKTQFPNHFESSESKKIDEHKLEGGDGGKSTITKEQFDKMSYNQRNELFKSDPDTYRELAGK